MRNHLLHSLFAAAALTVAPGCTACCYRPSCAVGGALPPGPPPGAIDQSGVPVAPQNPQIPPSPSPFLPSTPATRNYSSIPSAADLSWQPSNSSMPIVQLRPPEPATSVIPNENPRLNPPQVTEKVTPAPQKPAVVEDRSPPPALPVGIPQFAPVKDRVASGQRPMLDGLDWLKDNGYRTVLHLRRPGAEDAADRKEVEKRGMKYLTVEVSPQTVTRKLLDEFNRIANDSAGYPLFVYDRDGSLAGGLWYGYYRITQDLTDDVARVRAGAAGLRADRDSHRAMLLAVRQLLVPPANP